MRGKSQSHGFLPQNWYRSSQHLHLRFDFWVFYDFLESKFTFIPPRQGAISKTKAWEVGVKFTFLDVFMYTCPFGS